MPRRTLSPAERAARNRRDTIGTVVIVGVICLGGLAYFLYGALVNPQNMVTTATSVTENCDLSSKTVVAKGKVSEYRFGFECAYGPESNRYGRAYYYLAEHDAPGGEGAEEIYDRLQVGKKYRVEHDKTSPAYLVGRSHLLGVSLEPVA